MDLERGWIGKATNDYSIQYGVHSVESTKNNINTINQLPAPGRDGRALTWVLWPSDPPFMPTRAWRIPAIAART